MKELKIKVFTFDELPKGIQDTIIERERWNVMDRETEALEYDQTLEEFEKITDSRVTCYDTGYCGYRFGRVVSDKLAFGEFDLEDLSGELLFRYIDREIMPYLIRGKYYSTGGRYDENGKHKYKYRHSKIIMEGAGGCPLTGVCYDCYILAPLFDYYYNWARPEYRNLTFCDVMERCYDSLFKSIHEAYEYYASDEAVREYLSCRDDYYYENGTEYNDYVRGVA